MTFEKATTAAVPRWYLITKDGAAAVRIASGMQIGADAFGDLSLEPSNPLVALQLAEDGSLELTASSDSHELQPMGQERCGKLQLDPRTTAQISLLHHTLTINTELTSEQPSSDAVSIQVVAADGERPVNFAAPNTLTSREANRDTSDEIILVREALPAARPTAEPVHLLHRVLAQARLPSWLTVRNAKLAGIVYLIAIGGAYLLFNQQDTPAVNATPDSARANESELPPKPLDKPIRDDEPTATPSAEQQIATAAPAPDNPLPADASVPLESEQLPSEASGSLIQDQPSGQEQVSGVMSNLATATTAPAEADADGDTDADADADASQSATSTDMATATATVRPVPAVSPVIELNPTSTSSEPATDDPQPRPAQVANQPMTQETPEDITASAEPGPTDGSTDFYPISRLTALRQNPPAYPRIAPEGAEGSVELEMTVTESGAVRDVEIRGSASGYFARPAKRAVKSWKFQPVMKDGKPVPVRTRVKLTFRG
jgi:TonB family protein